jgi:hypothetical protein
VWVWVWVCRPLPLPLGDVPISFCCLLPLPRSGFVTFPHPTPTPTPTPHTVPCLTCFHSLSAVNFGVAGTGSDAGVGKAVVVIAGVFTVTNAVFNGFVICNHPAFRANKTQQNLKDEVCCGRMEHCAALRSLESDVNAGACVHANACALVPERFCLCMGDCKLPRTSSHTWITTLSSPVVQQPSMPRRASRRLVGSAATPPLWTLPGTRVLVMAPTPSLGVGAARVVWHPQVPLGPLTTDVAVMGRVHPLVAAATSRTMDTRATTGRRGRRKERVWCKR